MNTAISNLTLELYGETLDGLYPYRTGRGEDQLSGRHIPPEANELIARSAES